MSKFCVVCESRLSATASHRARFCSRACQQKAYRQRSRRGIPAEMTARPRWVRHDADKVPLTLFGRPASVVDPRTWTTYEKAAASTVGAGLGVVLGGGLGCIDLDHCIVGGKLAGWARAIVDEHRGEAFLIERSMSGEGVHIFLPLEEARGRRIRDGEVSIEIYSRERYIAVTGDRI